MKRRRIRCYTSNAPFRNLNDDACVSRGNLSLISDMDCNATGSITSIFQRLKLGEIDAAKQLWDRFFPRLVGLARKVLAGRELPAGAEDAVQTAFFAFFQQVELGSFAANADRFLLWKLLSVMTVRAARKQRRWENAVKRGGGRTLYETDLNYLDTDFGSLDELFGDLAGPECDLISEELLNALTQDEREVAIMRLAGYTNAEIKQITGCSLRSVERRLQLIRETWRAYVES